jgi:RHS repeat-associated protein
MTWDPKDRLSTATEAGVEHLHTYDYASKRTIHSVTKDGSTRRTYYIDDVSEFRDGRLVKYIYVGSEKVARSEFSGQPSEAIVPDLFYLHDHLGSTTVAMDPAGNARQLSSYSPYGHNRFKGLSGSKAIDYGFSGKELHEGPDLSYFETRFLSSGLARFNQTDTLTLNPPEDWRMSPQKWHPYSYCWGNPVTMVDKDGRDAVNSVENVASGSQPVFDFLSKMNSGEITAIGKACESLKVGAGYVSVVADGLVVGNLAAQGKYADASKEFVGRATGFVVGGKVAGLCSASAAPLCLKGASVGFLASGGVGAPIAAPAGCVVAVGSCYAAAWGAGYVAQKGATAAVGALQHGYDNMIDSGARLLQKIETHIQTSVSMGVSPF